MQRVLERSRRAVAAVAPKQKKEIAGRKKAESKQRSEERRRLTRGISQDIKDARKNRRTDWDAGPLAPRRDVGDKAETYGAISFFNLHLPERNPGDQLKWSMFVPGDRVVITKGRDRGKIGKVGEVDKKKGSVQVKDLNMVDVHVPEWIGRENQEERRVVPAPQQVPIEHVRLVHPLPDAETGVARDVVIDRVVRQGDAGDRFIPGANVVIAGEPEVEDEEVEAQEDDTPEHLVGQQTFTPCLLHPPMPMTVIDELRNKYSKFRTRHDYEYLQKKEQEDEKAEKRQQLGKTMRTPLQELAELRARQKKAAERELTEEQLARIGEVMEQEKARTLRTFNLSRPPGHLVQIESTV